MWYLVSATASGEKMSFDGDGDVDMQDEAVQVVTIRVPKRRMEFVAQQFEIVDRRPEKRAAYVPPPPHPGGFFSSLPRAGLTLKQRQEMSEYRYTDRFRDQTMRVPRYIIRAVDLGMKHGLGDWNLISTQVWGRVPANTLVYDVPAGFRFLTRAIWDAIGERRESFPVGGVTLAYIRDPVMHKPKGYDHGVSTLLSGSYSIVSEADIAQSALRALDRIAGTGSLDGGTNGGRRIPEVLRAAFVRRDEFVRAVDMKLFDPEALKDDAYYGVLFFESAYVDVWPESEFRAKSHGYQFGSDTEQSGVVLSEDTRDEPIPIERN